MKYSFVFLISVLLVLLSFCVGTSGPAWGAEKWEDIIIKIDRPISPSNFDAFKDNFYKAFLTIKNEKTEEEVGRIMDFICCIQTYRAEKNKEQKKVLSEITFKSNSDKLIFCGFMYLYTVTAPKNEIKFGIIKEILTLNIESNEEYAHGYIAGRQVTYGKKAMERLKQYDNTVDALLGKK